MYIKRKLLLFVMTISVTITLMFTMFYYNYNGPNNLLCTGNVNFYRESSLMSLSTQLFLESDHGSLSLNGFIINEKGQRMNVSRMILFKTKNIGTRYSWVSDEIISSIDENVSSDEQKKWFPPFYLHKDNKVEIYLKRLNFKSTLVSEAFLPYYICVNKN